MFIHRTFGPRKGMSTQSARIGSEKKTPLVIFFTHLHRYIEVRIDVVHIESLLQIKKILFKSLI